MHHVLQTLICNYDKLHNQNGKSVFQTYLAHKYNLSRQHRRHFYGAFKGHYQGYNLYVTCVSNNYPKYYQNSKQILFYLFQFQTFQLYYGFRNSQRKQSFCLAIEKLLPLVLYLYIKNYVILIQVLLKHIYPQRIFLF